MKTISELWKLNEQVFTPDQINRTMWDLCKYKKDSIHNETFKGKFSTEELTVDELQLSAIDYFIGDMYFKIQTDSVEATFLSTYHYISFIILMIRIKLCDEQILKIILNNGGAHKISTASSRSMLARRCSTLLNSQTQANSKTEWENNLKTLIDSALMNIENDIGTMKIMGVEFKYSDIKLKQYTTNFNALKIVVLGIDLNVMYYSYKLDDDATPPLVPQKVSKINMSSFTCDKTINIPKCDGYEVFAIPSTQVEIIYRNDTVLERQCVNRKGLLLLTNFKLCYIDSVEGKYSILLPYTKIADVRKSDFAKTEHKAVLEITSKENVFIRFSFRSNADSRTFYFKALQKLTFVNPNDLPIFKVVKPSTTQPTVYYSLRNEFDRLNLNNEQSKWRITTINSSYMLCSTYPKELIVPKDLSDVQVVDAAQFRSRQRIPVLTWIHKNGASITRCSQPLPGISSNKSQSDVQFLKAILNTLSGKKLHILDSRPKVNAVANIAVGGGYESEKDYPFCSIEFENIENIHAVREAWQKLCTFCMQTPHVDMKRIHLLQEVDHWWRIMKMIYVSSIKMCKYIFAGESVVVHCTDGWDRTSQCCSLSEIMMDRYYRTIDGFIVLIEKDWKSFGHKFMTRNGIGMKCPNNQYSPVFHQFIESVFILISNYPEFFEFNEQFLLDVDEASYCVVYGTFMFDSDCERAANHLEERTKSLWDYVINKRRNYVNPKYKPTDAPLFQSVPNFVMWENYYFKHKKN